MSGLIQGHCLVIDESSLPTLARRMRKDMPGQSFAVSNSARENKVVVRITQIATHEAREAFRKLVQSL